MSKEPPKSLPMPEKIILDGSDEALAVMLALEQAQRNNERRRAEKEMRERPDADEDMMI